MKGLPKYYSATVFTTDGASGGAIRALKYRRVQAAVKNRERFEKYVRSRFPVVTHVNYYSIKGDFLFQVRFDNFKK